MNNKILKTVIPTILITTLTFSIINLVYASNGDTTATGTSTTDAATGGTSSTATTTSEPRIPKPESLPGPSDQPKPGEEVKVKSYFTSQLLPTITRGIIASAGGFAFILLIIGGIRYLTSYGNEEQQTAAKNTIMWAVIGLVIATLSYAIVSIIVSLITK